MSLQSACEAANEPYFQAVMYNTWGHLAPKIGTSYNGFILFGTSGFGCINPLLLDAEFYEPNGEQMGASPWSYDHIEDYLVKRFELGCWNKKKPIFKPGCVYKFNGTYTIYKNGSHSFNGKIRKINTT